MAAAIHVVAGVVQDAAGRILLTRRSAGRDLAGLWEFPGGKSELGETPEQALRRELQEELGIEIAGATPLISVPQAYPHKRIVLDVYRVTAYQGQPHGRERQALAWTPPHKLPDYAMPPADRPVVAALLSPACYAISPAPAADDDAVLAWAEQALAQGLRRLQLRAPALEPERRERLAHQLHTLCRSAAAELLINSDRALAQRLGLGLHLRSEQLRRLRRRPWTEGAPIAASCHNLQDLRQAEALGLDFAVLGPVAATASHPEARPLGWDGFAALRERVALPIYALGGLNHADLEQARRCGAQGIAGIRGFAAGAG